MEGLTILVYSCIAWIVMILLLMSFTYSNDIQVLFFYKHKILGDDNRHNFTLLGTRKKEEDISDLNFFIKNFFNTIFCLLFLFFVLSCIGAFADFMLLPLKHFLHYLW